MTTHQRTTAILRRTAGDTIRQIAASLGLSMPTVARCTRDAYQARLAARDADIVARVAGGATYAEAAAAVGVSTVRARRAVRRARLAAVLAPSAPAP